MRRPSIVTDRRTLMALAIVLGLAELADAFSISFWEAAAVFSALYLVGAWWVRRGGIGGPIFVGALCVFELQSYPTWQRTGLEDWITQTAFATGAAACLVVAVAALWQTRAARKTVEGASA